MGFSDVIEAIEKMYQPGCVAFYEKRTPDEWQEAFDEIQTHSPHDPDFEEACQRTIARFRVLTQRFIEDGNPSKTINLADAFALGESHESKRSTVEKTCYACQSTQNLEIERFSQNYADVRLTCIKHKTRPQHQSRHHF